MDQVLNQSPPPRSGPRPFPAALRILLLSQAFQGGGAERAARELFVHLSQRGHAVTMLVARDAPDDPAGVVASHNRLERWCTPLRKLLPACNLFHSGSNRCLAAITQTNVDVVHIHAISQGWLSIPAVADLCRRVPSVWTMHDEWALTLGLECDMRDLMTPSEVYALRFGIERLIPWSRYHDNFRFRRKYTYLRKYLPQPQVVTCDSWHLMRRMIAAQRFPTASVRNVTLGLPFMDLPETCMPREEARQRLNLPSGTPLALLIAGDLRAPHKGLALALRALAQIPAVRRPALVLVGGKAHKAARATGDMRFFVRCCKSDADLATLYRAVDVLLLPSVVDQFPYVGMESLACSTPLVGFRIGGPAEIAGQNERGLLAEPFDVTAYAKQLCTLLENPALRQELGAAGRIWVERIGAVPAYLNAMETAYHDARASFALSPSGVR
ncbi:MAG: glycosyltransferase [Phycisphaerae bacterium]